MKLRPLLKAKRYSLLLAFPFVFFLINNASAQTASSAYPLWGHPAVKALERHDPAFMAFTRSPDLLVNLCIVDKVKGKAYYVSQFGFVFDTINLTADRKRQLQEAGKQTNPFRWYEDSVSQYFPILESAKDFLRANGSHFTKASATQQSLFSLPLIKQMPTTLAKLLGIEEYERAYKGRLLNFNWRISSAGDTAVQNRLSEGLKPGSMVIHGTPDSGYSEFINKELYTSIHKARLEHTTGEIRIYDWKNREVDSFLISKSKIKSLVNEKTDVFVLYHVWLEWHLQRINAALPGWQYAANYEFLKNKGDFLYADFIRPQSSRGILIRLKQEQRRLIAKISGISAIDVDLFSTIFAIPTYKKFKSTRQWNGQSWIVAGSRLYSEAYAFTRGQKRYELTDHRGNVVATVSDKKTEIDINGDGTVDRYEADITMATDYYSFGSEMPGRKYKKEDGYGYGFNGKENDNEVKGEGNQQDYGMRIYDPRVGRFLSVDPLAKKYAQLSSYQFASNSPVDGIDLDGSEWLSIVYLILKTKPVQQVIYKQAVIDAYKHRLNSDERLALQQYKGLGRFAENGIDVAEKWTQLLSLGSSRVVTEKMYGEARKAAQEIQKTEIRIVQEPAARSVSNDPRNNVSTESPNRGTSTALEDVSKRNLEAQAYEDGAIGAASDVGTRKRIVPTLKYDNPNPKGRNFVKWDGYDIEKDELIDRKLDVTTFEKTLNQIRRMSEALKQNPDKKGVIEVPNQKAYNNGIRALNRAGVTNISIRIVK